MIVRGEKEDIFLYKQTPEMKNRATQILIHIVCSLAFLSIPILSPPPGSGSLASIMGNAHFLQDFSGIVLTLIFFYACYYYIIPRYFFTGKYIPFTLFCLLGFAIIIWLPNMWREMPHAHPMGSNFRMDRPREGWGYHFYIGHITHNFLRFAVVLSVALMLKINNRMKQVQREKLNTEVSFLKAQINPHFLFNTLNSIYSLTLSKSDDAPKAVVKLSGIMRYAISEANHDYVSLEKEITYISNYIDLQKLRLTPKVKVVYEVTGNPGNAQIAPFLLIPFIENAFKYGVNSEEDSNIQVTLTITSLAASLFVYNNKVYVQKDNAFATGIGINNTSTRLAMLYSGRHSLEVNDGADDFSVSLKIDLA
jgi:hypothetical protein